MTNEKWEMTNGKSVAFLNHPNIQQTQLTRVAGAGIDEAPAAINFFEDGIAVGIEASLRGKDLTDAVPIQIELIDEIDAGKKAFRQRLVGLEFHEVGAHSVALRLGDQKQIALEFVFRCQREAADYLVLPITI